MNRYQYIIAFFVLIGFLSMPVLFKHFSASALKKEIDEIEDSIDFSSLSAAVKLKELGSGKEAVKQTYNTFINTYSHIANIDPQEVSGYIPIFIIMSNNNYYLYRGAINGYPCTDNIETYCYGSDDNGSFCTLDGKCWVNGSYNSAYTPESLFGQDIRSLIQTSIETKISDVLTEYNASIRDNGVSYSYSLTNNITVNPAMSIIVVFQGYPLKNTGKTYGNTHQSSAQIENIN